MDLQPVSIRFCVAGRWQCWLAGCIIFDMMPFCLYFVASVITGFHVYTLLTPAVYGAPWNPLELVSLLGSLCLLIAAYVSLFKPHAAARLALIACLAIWCFYGPAIAKSIRSKLGEQSSVLPGSLLITHPEFSRAQATMVFSIASGALTQDWSFAPNDRPMF